MGQVKIPAVFMRGGTSKGVFFRREDLPADPDLRDRVLLRIIGSPDPYGQHIDGMGGATSSTSKVVLIAPSASRLRQLNNLIRHAAQLKGAYCLQILHFGEDARPMCSTQLAQICHGRSSEVCANSRVRIQHILIQRCDCLEHKPLCRQNGE